jgi:hypothetical protein
LITPWKDPAAADRPIKWDDGRWVVAGWLLPKALMRSMPVEVTRVLVQDHGCVALVVDQHPVGALLA